MRLSGRSTTHRIAPSPTRVAVSANSPLMTVFSAPSRDSTVTPCGTMTRAGSVILTLSIVRSSPYVIDSRSYVPGNATTFSPGSMNSNAALIVFFAVASLQPSFSSSLPFTASAYQVMGSPA